MSFWAFDASASNPWPKSRIGIDLRDLIQYEPQTAEILRPALEAIHLDPERYLGTWNNQNLIPLSATVTSEPERDAASGSWVLPLAASAKTVKNKFALLSLRLAVRPDGEVALLDRGDLKPAAGLSFRVRTSLADRKTVIEEPSIGWKKTYPVAVGGFNFGVTPGAHGHTVLVTPRFSSAWLPRGQATEKRGGYYKNLPFVRIVDSRMLYEGYAFHVYVNAEDENAPANDADFRRGFHSHGCIRMREGDLKEFWGFVAKSAPTHTPFATTLRSDSADSDESPLPLDDETYWSVRNFGTPKKTRTRRDTKTGLTIMELVLGRPPIEELEPFAFDSGPIDPQWLPSVRDGDAVLSSDFAK